MGGMSSNTRVMNATPQQVWDILADGWLYPLWVVGASRMREVDDDWPALGSQLHHSVGAWPLLLDDTTEVLDVQPGSSLILRARAWPAGAATVRIRLSAVGTQTEVTMEEDASQGPATLIPKPVRDVQLRWRNVESLRRLAYLAERRP
jgi:uncharacterized protein YndB with AHSA1/START domain